MTKKLWAFAAVFLVLWLLAGGVVGWSIYALQTGRMTTSQFVSEVGPGWIVVAGIVAGAIVTFVASHWWFPARRLRWALLGIVIGAVVGSAVGAIWWPISR